MKFSAAALIFSLVALSSATPHSIAKKDGKLALLLVPCTPYLPTPAVSAPYPIVKRQVPVEIPSMKVGGVVVPFTGGGPKGNGGNKKREAEHHIRRQVDVEVPSMKVGGVVVPFSGGGPKGNGGN